MKIIKLKKERNESRFVQSLNKIKETRAVKYLGGVKNSANAKINVAKNKVCIYAEQVKRSRVGVYYAQARQKVADKHIALKTRASITSFHNTLIYKCANLKASAKREAGKFKEYAKYKFHNIRYDFGVFKDAITSKLCSTNLKLYNRSYYNYVLTTSAEDNAKRNSKTYADQIYKESVNVLVQNPTAYAGLTTNGPSNLLECLKDAVAKSAFYAQNGVNADINAIANAGLNTNVTAIATQPANQGQGQNINKVNQKSSTAIADATAFKPTTTEDLEKPFSKFGKRTNLVAC